MTVIPSPADLQAMRERTRSRLTDEGAQSWYVNDVVMLLDEVARLKLIEDLWNHHAEGFWERAQTKKLRDEIRELRQSYDDLSDTVVRLDDSNKELQEKLAERSNALENLHDTVGALKEIHRAEMESEQGEQIALRDEITRLNAALVDCNQRCEQVLAMQHAQTEQTRLAALEGAEMLARILRNDVV